MSNSYDLDHLRRTTTAVPGLRRRGITTLSGGAVLNCRNSDRRDWSVRRFCSRFVSKAARDLHEKISTTRPLPERPALFQSDKHLRRRTLTAIPKLTRVTRVRSTPRTMVTATDCARTWTTVRRPRRRRRRKSTVHAGSGESIASSGNSPRLARFEGGRCVGGGTSHRGWAVEPGVWMTRWVGFGWPVCEARRAVRSRGGAILFRMAAVGPDGVIAGA